MKTYNFPGFSANLENPDIEINFNTISDKRIDKLISVDVFLTSGETKIGVRFSGMPYISESVPTNSDIEEMVNLKLESFEVI